MINYEYIDPVQLTSYVREVPGPAQYNLNQYLPDVYIADVEAAWDIINRTNRAATFRTWDAEMKFGRRDSHEKRRVGLPPIGEKNLIGEWDRIQLERARTGGNNYATIIGQIYDDADAAVRSISARMEIARGDVLTDGKFTLVDEDGLTLEANFDVPGTHLVTASTPWTDYDNSDPIADMLGWNDTYAIDAGEPPGIGLTSRVVTGHLRRNAKMRTYAASLAGTPQILSQAQVDAVLDSFGLPRLREYNTSIQNSNGVAVRPIPQDRLVYLPSDPRSLGMTAWGITAEALELVNGQNPGLVFEQAPGLVGVVEKLHDPLRVITRVGATGMPIITDPRRLFVADVI